MATILKSDQREFEENPNKIDHYRIFTDRSRVRKGINPQNLNFDLRQLNPGQYSAPYHFHRYAEELFMIISGKATLRTPNGLEIVDRGDLIFFEMGETGAHQLYNHTTDTCTFLDIRSYIGFDVCEYPDSNKLLIAPTFEIFDKDAQVNYFHGEDNIIGKWKQIEDKKELEEYEYAKMREQDERGEIELAEDRAKHTEKIEIAKEMILENEPIAKIVRYTKLDVEIIQKIIDIQNIK